MQIHGDIIIFSTGKRFYANNGIIGLAEPSKDEFDSWEGWNVSEGYDGGINFSEFTKKEQIELAEYMISLWQRFKRDVIIGGNNEP